MCEKTLNDLLFAWPIWLMQLGARPLVDLTDLVDVNLSDLFDITIQTGNTSTTGNPAIEREVYSSVARVGKQLGYVADAVLELAKKTGHADGKDIKQLAQLVQDVEYVKKKTAKDRARKSLADLKKIDPQGFKKLIESELIESEMRNGASQPTGQSRK